MLSRMQNEVKTTNIMMAIYEDHFLMFVEDVHIFLIRLKFKFNIGHSSHVRRLKVMSCNRKRATCICQSLVVFGRFKDGLKSIEKDTMGFLSHYIMMEMMTMHSLSWKIFYLLEVIYAQTIAQPCT